jgi:hypothetical protein
MLDMHTPPSLNLRQWFAIGVDTYLLTCPLDSSNKLLARVHARAGVELGPVQNKTRLSNSDQVRVVMPAMLCAYP